VDVYGRTAVVTGSASGIGRSTALELARRGADVVVADIHEDRLAETAAGIEALGRRALAVRCDVTSDADTVGTLVCDAIAAERFAIFTNDDDAVRYTSWRDDIDRSLAEAIAAAPTPPRIV